MSISKKLMTTGATGDTYVEDVFSTYLYEGTGADQDIVNGIDLDGKGGMVWTKARTSGWQHALFDTERGATKRLGSNSTAAETTWPDTLTAFNSNGFSLGADSTYFVNKSGDDYVGWTFRKEPSFFDVVTYTGDTTYNRRVEHNLGIKPGMIIVKSIDVGRSWYVWHRGISDTYGGVETPGDQSGGTETDRLLLDKSDAKNDQGIFTYVNEDAFGLVYSAFDCNVSGEEYVAYVFAHDDSDEGMIQCGSYAGNGSPDGPEIDLGWEPQWLLIKNATSVDDWILIDTMRGTDGTMLKANEPDTENPIQGGPVALTPTGFKLNTNNNNLNQYHTYIYMAIRRPNKPAEEFEADELFAVTPSTNTSPRYVSGFPVDMGIRRFVTNESGNYLHTRLTGKNKLWTDTTSSLNASDGAWMDYNNGMTAPDYGAVGDDRLAWMWRRAPGFFDVVTYTGRDGSIPHGLGVPPEMVWIKELSGDVGLKPWAVFSPYVLPDQGSSWGKGLKLNELDAANTDSLWTSDYAQQFTATEMNIRYGATETNNGTLPYLALFFASVPGISKIGTYVGNGNNDGPVVDCGFTPRFILIKAIDSNGNWVLMDTVRGIAIPPSSLCGVVHLDTEKVIANDSLIDPAFEGFKVTNGAGKVNALNKNYLFYAIA